MAQNIYDHGEFFDAYVQLPRQIHGLGSAPEWPSMRSMIPALDGKRVLDLGCGFGWISRWAAGSGATDVVGVDLSHRMLERARASTESAAVRYVQADLDELDELDVGSMQFDIAVSSLALHYVTDLGRLFATIEHALMPGGSIVFSVEHPIYSAPTQQQFETLADGRRVWPLEKYLVEGPRTTSWFVDGFIKHHRTVASYVNELVDAGFRIDRLDEWGPSADQIAERPEVAVDRNRPWFLLVAATKPDY